MNRLTSLASITKLNMRLLRINNLIEKGNKEEWLSADIEKLETEKKEIEQKLNINNEVNSMSKKDNKERDVEKKEKQPYLVKDGETGEFIEIDNERLQRAMTRQQQIYMGTSIAALSMVEQIETKDYLALECETKEEYISRCTPFSRTTFFRLETIAKKMRSVTKLLSGEELKPLSLTDGSIDVSALKQTGADPLSVLNEIGTTKFYELTDLADEEFADLLKKGSVNLPGGTLEINEIYESTSRELQKKIAQAKKELNAKISQLNEDNKLLRAEKKQLLKERDENKSKVDDLQTDLAIYGPQATKLKDKAEHLTVAQKLLTEAQLACVKAGVLFSDPDGLRSDLVNTVKKFDEVHNILMNHYSEILAEE